MNETLEELEQYAVDVIFGRRRGVRAFLLRGVLRALSKVFAGLVSVRLRLYRKRLLREHNLGTMVISVGNLTVGGTGKTPVVELLARSLKQGGCAVAILSRGYKSEKPPAAELRRLQAERRARRRRHRVADPWQAALEEDDKEPPRVVSDGRRVLLDSRAAGDEPFMLAVNVPDVPVVVDKDRVKAGRYAVRHFGADVLVLDDGLQYLKLRRRLDIVLVDRQQPFGNEHMLPRGTLREPPRNLRRAHYILITKCDGRPNDELKRRLRQYNRTAEIIECRHAPLYLENLLTGQQLALSTLRGKHIGALSAIAAPESFERELRRLGAKVEATRRFADHHRFSPRQIQEFINRCVNRDVDFIVTTEKDAVRFPTLEDPDVPLYFLRMEIEILAGHEAWQRCVDLVCQPPPYQPPARVA